MGVLAVGAALPVPRRPGLPPQATVTAETRTAKSVGTTAPLGGNMRLMRLVSRMVERPES